jgi:hypothetical protein
MPSREAQHLAGSHSVARDMKLIRRPGQLNLFVRPPRSRGRASLDGDVYKIVKYRRTLTGGDGRLCGRRLLSS